MPEQSASATMAAATADPVAWRPKGALIATMHEHKGPVNRLAVSRDNTFLASGVQPLAVDVLPTVVVDVAVLGRIHVWMLWGRTHTHTCLARRLR